jgi:curved DNA-binding protein CbpA
MESIKFKDYYDLLNVDKEATLDQIKKAFMKKALMWHPDKASTDQQKEAFSKVYEELQKAYKILSNEDSRRQYNDSQQATNIDLAKAERDLSYIRSTEYTKITPEGVKFDLDSFIKDFESVKHEKEDISLTNSLGWSISQTRPDGSTLLYCPSKEITRLDYESYLKQREEDDNRPPVNLKELLVKQEQGTFNNNVFNNLFDKLKKANPSTSLELYQGDPLAADFGQGYDNGNLDNLTGTFNMQDILSGLDTTILNQETQESKIDTREAQQRVLDIQKERECLSDPRNFQFEVVPSEMEKMYPSLFSPMRMEELEPAPGETVEQFRKRMSDSHS